MPATVDQLNRILAALTSFGPAQEAPRASPVPWLPKADEVPWEEVVAAAERHGLAPIISHQIEYRFASRLAPPEWVRERLQNSFHGALNDNVFKLVELKRWLSGAGPPVVLLGGAAVADSLFPHIAFRPLSPALEVLVRPADLEVLIASLGEQGLRPQQKPGTPAPLMLSDGRMDLVLNVKLPGLRLSPSEDEALWGRRTPLAAYGPRAFRLAPEDGFLAALGEIAAQGFQVPRIQLVDLREMALRAVGGGAPGWEDSEYRSNPELLRRRARSFGLVRALQGASALIAELFPEAREAAAELRPSLPNRRAALLNSLVVSPLRDPRRQSVVRGSRTLLKVLLRPRS
jgi:hypothetical protein